MKIHKILLFILILPLTLFLDLLMYGLLKTCSSCSSFAQFITTEGALSFPIVIGASEWISQFLPKAINNKQ